MQVVIISDGRRESEVVLQGMISAKSNTGSAWYWRNSLFDTQWMYSWSSGDQSGAPFFCFWNCITCNFLQVYSNTITSLVSQRAASSLWFQAQMPVCALHFFSFHLRSLVSSEQQSCAQWVWPCNYWLTPKYDLISFNHYKQTADIINAPYRVSSLMEPICKLKVWQ